MVYVPTNPARSPITIDDSEATRLRAEWLAAQQSPHVEPLIVEYPEPLPGVSDEYLFTHDDNSVSHTPPRGLFGDLMSRPEPGAHATEQQPTGFESAWLTEQQPARPEPQLCTGIAGCLAGVHFPGSATQPACLALDPQEAESVDAWQDRVQQNKHDYYGHGPDSLLDGPECDRGVNCPANLHRPGCAELNRQEVATLRREDDDMLRNQYPHRYFADNSESGGLTDEETAALERSRKASE
jgi:hypothetical protein